MKKFKKLIAMVIAFGALATSIGSMSANAEDMNLSVSSENEAVAALIQQTDALLDANEITLDQANRLKSMLSESNESENYPHYDDLCTNVQISSNDNRIAFVTNPAGSGFTVGTNRYVDIYINQNILTTGLMTSHFLSGVVSVKSVVDLGGSASCRHYRIYFDVTSAISAGVVLFTFKFPTYVYNNSNIVFEEDLHLATVQNIANPSFVLDAWNNNIAYKCHYAPGDVNHDGYVNDDDALLIMKYIVGLLTLPTTRPEMDRVSFKQAADVNGDGDIDILDAISI